MPSGQSKRHLPQKVGYSHRGRNDGGQFEERDVQIYDNADRIRERVTEMRLQDAGAAPQNRPPVLRRSLRGAALAVGVLCLLLAAGIIVLSALYFSLRLEKGQQTRFSLNVSCHQSESELKQLHDKIRNMTAHNRLLQEEVTKVKVKTKAECPQGWTGFGSSCYFKFTEKETWSRSREECGNRVSHLVMINSRDEQEFVAGLSLNDESWIGLRTTEDRASPTELKWEWVDDSAPTETFWADGRWDPPTDKFYVTCCDQQGKWTKHTQPEEKRNYVCEK